MARAPARAGVDAAWCAALIGLTLGYHWRYLGWFGAQRSFGDSDFTNVFWPLHKFNIQEWLAGRVPLWNPSFAGGLPQLGNTEAAVFYPFSLVELLLDGRGGPMTGIYTRVWLDTSVATLGMYFLALRLTGIRSAAALSAVTYGFSGLLLGYAAAQISYLEALAWMPLGLLFLDRVLTSERWLANTGLAGLMLAPAFLGGYPQMWLLIPVTMVAALAAAWGRRAAPFRWRVSLAAILTSLAFAVTLPAIQLVPGMEFFLNSYRSASPGDGHGYAWHELAGLVFPGTDGDKGMYVGALPLLVVPAALALGAGRRPMAPWVATTILGLLLSLGDTTPLYELVFSHLPFGLFRNQTRNIALVVLSLSVLTGLGAASLAFRWPRLRRVLAALPILAAVNLVGVNWESNWPIESPFVPTIERFPRLVQFLTREQQRERMRFAIDGPKGFFSPQEAFAHDLETISTEVNFQIKRSYDLLSTAAYWRQWQLFNVRFIGSTRDLTGDGIVEVPEARDGDVRLYRMLYPLPRGYVVWDAQVVHSPEEAFRATLDGSFDPGMRAILEVQPSSPIFRPRVSEQRVQQIAFAPGEVTLRVEIDQPGLLVLSQPYYPGWKAEVDGRFVEPLRANYALTALPLPAGDQLVRLRYEPESLRLGGAISALSLAGLFWVLVVSARRPGAEDVQDSGTST
ncbi:MAG: YfhO family protein [Chloroflexi bacterium]|nr:YfhO family protein [Chloroflexota bacterium]